MATLTFSSPTDASETLTPAAIAPAGDKFVMTSSQRRKNVLLVFNNGHSAPITVTIAGVAKTVDAGRGFGVGTFIRANREIVVTNATSAGMLIASAELESFLDAEGELNLSYTGGNAAMTVLAFNI